MTIKSYSRGLSSWDRCVRGASGPTCSPPPVFSTHEISSTSSSSASDWSLLELLDSLWFFFAFFFFDFFLQGKICCIGQNLVLMYGQCLVVQNTKLRYFNRAPPFFLKMTLTFYFSSFSFSFSSPLKNKQANSVYKTLLTLVCVTSHKNSMYKFWDISNDANLQNHSLIRCPSGASCSSSFWISSFSFSSFSCPLWGWNHLDYSFFKLKFTFKHCVLI